MLEMNLNNKYPIKTIYNKKGKLTKGMKKLICHYLKVFLVSEIINLRI